MSDVDDYIKEHMSNPEFAKSFNEGLPELLVGEKCLICVRRAV